MMLPDPIRHRIDALLASADPIDQEVGRRLAGRLPTRGLMPSSTSGTADRAPSRWQHVDLADLLAHLGNPVEIFGYKIKSGHEPVHGSRSGSCLVAWPAEGRWWCSSCSRSGDAATLVIQAQGISYAEAARWLTGRYGSPPAARVSLRHRAFGAVLP